MRILYGHRWAVRAVAYAPHDPTLLVTGGDDGTVRLWDTQAAENVATFHDRTGAVLALAFAPDGGRLVSSGRSQRLVLWNADLRQYVDNLSLETVATAVGFASDGSGVFAALQPPPLPF